MHRVEDDDDDFSIPQSSSRLANLFSQESQAVSDDSFKYKAPKDPSQRTQFSDSIKKAKVSPKTTLLCAYSGHCFKLINGQYAEGQKLGVAIIGEVHNNLYSILLYVTKDKPISFTRITPSTVVEIGTRNFVSFTDDARQFWSVGFEREEEVAGFSKQVGIARWMSGNGSNIMKQDLFKGDGNSINVGDLVEVKVKRFHLVTEGVLILDLIREDSVKFKVGKKTVPQIWDETVVGMSKCGQRLIIYMGEDPQALKEPGDKTLRIQAEELTILRVKHARGKEAQRTDDQVDSTEVGENDSFHVAAQLHNVDESQASKTRSPIQEREVLMNRIKKLGQPLLPLSEAPSQDDQMAEEGNSRPPSVKGRSECLREKEDFVVSQMLMKPDIRPKPPQITKVLHDTRTQAVLAPQDYQLMKPMAFNPFIPTTTFQHHMPDHSISLLTIEMKQQNLDLKSLLMRTSEKIDAINSKMDEFKKTCIEQSLLPSSSASSSSPSPLLQYEVEAVSQGINKIFKDNEILRKELKEKDMKIGRMNQKLSEIGDDNQRLLKKNLTEINSSPTTKLTEENVALRNSLEEMKNQLSQSQSDYLAAQQLLQTKLQEANDLKEQLESTKILHSSEQAKANSKILEERSRLESELERLQKELERKENHLKLEREERLRTEQEKKTGIVERDRTISELRETLMKRNMTDSDSKVVLREVETEMKAQMRVMEELHVARAKVWEQEREEMLGKLSEVERQHRLSIEIISKKDAELKVVNEELAKCSKELKDANKEHQMKLSDAIAQKNLESQVIKDELMKLSQEYNTVKTLAKDIKEKYDWMLEQHNNHMEKNNIMIKGLMNNIYRCLKDSFDPDESYTGAWILGCASKIIKIKTVEVMNDNSNQNNMSTSSSSLQATYLQAGPAKPVHGIRCTETPSTYSSSSSLSSSTFGESSRGVESVRSAGGCPGNSQGDDVGAFERHYPETRVTNDDRVLNRNESPSRTEVSADEGPESAVHGRTSEESLSDEHLIPTRATSEEGGTCQVAGGLGKTVEDEISCGLMRRSSTGECDRETISIKAVEGPGGEEQPRVGDRGVDPSNEDEKNVNERTSELTEDSKKVESGFIGDSPFNSSPVAISNDDDAHVKPPPFPDSDVDEDDW